MELSEHKRAELEAQGLKAMVKARAALVLEQAFFGSLALRLTLQADSKCRDLWTDGTTLGFNPAYAATLPHKKLVGAQAHEIMHLACGHHVRRKNRSPHLWNKACDYAINDILVEAGFTLPTGFLLDPRYAGLSVDAIFSELIREENEGAHNSSNLGASEHGSNEKRDDAMTAGDEKSLLNTKGTARETEKKEEEKTNEKAQRGTAQTGTASSTSEEIVPFVGEIRDAQGLSEGDYDGNAQTKAEQDANIAVAQAMQRAKHMGTLPASFIRLIKKQISPQLDWTEVLQRFLEMCMNGDYTWNTPNRRYLYQDIYLPSRREPSLPSVALAVDCSGSIDENMLELFCAELSTILEQYDTRLHVLFHDTRVQQEYTFERQDLPLKLTPSGGGGTDFREIPRYLEEQNISPVCLLWFTDLECTQFSEEPPYPVLWLVSGTKNTDVPFGEVLSLTETV